MLSPELPSKKDYDSVRGRDSRINSLTQQTFGMGFRSSSQSSLNRVHTEPDEKRSPFFNDRNNLLKRSVPNALSLSKERIIIIYCVEDLDLGVQPKGNFGFSDRKPTTKSPEGRKP